MTTATTSLFHRDAGNNITGKMSVNRDTQIETAIST
jgi:hypothetical protein